VYNAVLTPRRVHLRQCKYLNTVVEQDHRAVKKRVWLAKGYGSFLPPAWRTLQGIEAVNMIRKGRARRVAKKDAMAQAAFIAALFASLPNSKSRQNTPSRLFAGSNLRNEPVGQGRALAVCGLSASGLADGRNHPHNTKTPLTVWFWAAHLMTTDKRGVSALLCSANLRCDDTRRRG